MLQKIDDTNSGRYNTCKNPEERYLRFRGVVRSLDMTNVLSALEDPECKARQKVPGREQSSRRSQSKSSVLLQEFADFLQLRYTMRFEDLFFLQLLEGSSIFHASVFRYQVDDRVEHTRPGLVLRFGVRNVRYRVTILVRESDLRNDLPTSTILLVSESRMVHVKIRFVFGHQMIAVVELGRVSWEPGIFDADGIIPEQSNAV